MKIIFKTNLFLIIMWNILNLGHCSDEKLFRNQIIRFAGKNIIKNIDGGIEAICNLPSLNCIEEGKIDKKTKEFFIKREENLTRGYIGDKKYKKIYCFAISSISRVGDKSHCIRILRNTYIHSDSSKSDYHIYFLESSRPCGCLGKNNIDHYHYESGSDGSGGIELVNHCKIINKVMNEKKIEEECAKDSKNGIANFISSFLKKLTKSKFNIVFTHFMEIII